MRFTGTLTTANETGGHWVECPFDAKTEFGAARPLVRGSVNGVALRTRLASYGGRTYLGLIKAVRTEAGIGAGSVLDIELEADDQPREVDVPPELAAALAANPQAAQVFEALAFTNRNEYARWIGEAKRDETRQRRLAKAIEMLTAGTKHP